MGQSILDLFFLMTWCYLNPINHVLALIITLNLKWQFYLNVQATKRCNIDNIMKITNQLAQQIVKKKTKYFHSKFHPNKALKCLPNLGDIFVNNVATRDWLPSMETKFKERHNNLNLFDIFYCDICDMVLFLLTWDLRIQQNRNSRNKDWGPRSCL